MVGPTRRGPSRPPLVLTVAVELTTVGDDVAIVHDGVEVRRYDELEPDTTYVLDGVEVRTLERPPGELLCRFATVNDVHFGETDCGRLDESQPELGPILTVDAGQPPHPELMGRAAVPEIEAIEPSAVVAKGDLTAWGTRDEYAAFLACYGQAFGDRLHHVRGNHDAMAGETYADGPQRIDLPGVTVALLDTVVPGSDSGTVDADQLAWLDDLSATARVPVVVMAHHYPWSPDSTTAPDSYFGIHPDGLAGPRRADRPPDLDRRLLRRPLPPQPRASVLGDRPGPLRGGGLRQGLPRELGRVPGVRGRHPPAPPPHLRPRRPGLERALPRAVRRLRRRLRGPRPRRHHRSVLRLRGSLRWWPRAPRRSPTSG